jgi:hypothetical protein
MFERGVTDPDQALIKALHEDPTWHPIWDEITKDKDLFPAVRKNVIHVYHRGCRLFEFSLSAARLRVRTHYKYLLDPRVRSAYVAWGPHGELGIADSQFRDYFTKRAEDLGALKTAASAYAGQEKVGVHALAKANRSNLLDLEIALSDDETSPDEDNLTGSARRRVADRIDFAVLQEAGGAVQLAFFEAKHFDNAELRARGSEKAPPVIEQMLKYENLIAKFAEDIKRSYLRVCQNLVQLQPCSSLIKQVAAQEIDFTIAQKVRLVVFGFDAAQRDGVWAEHQNKLVRLRGQPFVICVGDPADYQQGISKVNRLD